MSIVQYLAFEVQSLEASIAKLRAVGIETGEVIDVGRTVPGRRICLSRDPRAISSN